MHERRDLWKHRQEENPSHLCAGVKTAELSAWEPGEGRCKYEVSHHVGNKCWGLGGGRGDQLWVCGDSGSVFFFFLKLWDVECQCMTRCLLPHCSMVRAVSWKQHLLSRFVTESTHTHTELVSI